MTGLALRDYQLEAIDAVRAAWDRGVQRPAVVMPTGSGKTVCFARLAADAGSALVLVHRDELVTQTVAKVRAVAGIEAGVVKAERDETDRPVVVASVQTLAREHRLARVVPPEIVIIDEAHHATATTYRKILDHCGRSRAVGFTATMERGDGGRLGDVWSEIVYRRGIIDMIRAGHLADVEGYRLDVEDLDLSGVAMRGGDFSDADLGRALGDSIAPEMVARCYTERYPGMPAILFAPTVETAMLFADALGQAGVRVGTVWGAQGLDERRKVLRAYEHGELDVLCNCMVLCLDSETEILTDRGWTRCPEMTPGHRVANWDRGEVFFEEPLEIVRRLLGRHERMYRLVTRGRDIRVTGGHRMLYRTAAGQEWKKAAVEDLVGRNVLIPTVGWAKPFDVVPDAASVPAMAQNRAVTATSYNLRKREGYSPKDARTEAERRVGRRRGLQYSTPAELTLDQCRFVGFWLGDGSHNDPIRGGVEYTASQSTVYPRIIEWFDEVILRCALDAVRRDHSSYEIPHIRWSFPRGTGGGSQERDGIFGIEPYLDKDGSQLLWGLNDQQFEALLEGLWYADGNHGQATSGYPVCWQIFAYRKGLLDLLQAIGTVRGMNLTVRKMTAPCKDDHAQMWALTRSATFDHRTARHRFELDPQPWQPEQVWCVKTTTRNIITRRNGTVTVMGNTEGFDSPRAQLAILARPTASAPLFVQMVGRVLRPYPGKAKAVVLDVVGATGRHELATLATLGGLKAEVRAGTSLLEAWDVEEDERAEQERRYQDGKASVRAVDLFGGSRQRWLQTKDGRWFLPGQDRYITIQPSPESNGTELWDVASWNKLKGGRWISRGVPGVELAMSLGEADITFEEQMYAEKDRAWRKRKASEKQLAFLASLAGQAVAESMTGRRAGEVGDLLSVELASRRIDPGLRRYLS
jgi:superfamily II DNA or RNA helicase